MGYRLKSLKEQGACAAQDAVEALKEEGAG
jgi:hypothetical protein